MLYFVGCRSRRCFLVAFVLPPESLISKVSTIAFNFILANKVKETLNNCFLWVLYSSSKVCHFEDMLIHVRIEVVTHTCTHSHRLTTLILVLLLGTLLRGKKSFLMLADVVLPVLSLVRCWKLVLRLLSELWQQD